MASVPIELLIVSPLLIAGIALLPRRDEMLLRSQGVVLCIQQSTNAHEAKRPLIACRDRSADLEREIDTLLETLKQLKKTPQQEQTQKEEIQVHQLGDRLQELGQALKQQAAKITKDSQKGVDFLNQVIANTQDPLYYTPKCEVVSMSDCVDLAMRMANFQDLSRIHVDTKENFQVVGNLGLLASVLVNAIENAEKNSDSTDRIAIRLHTMQHRNQVSIYNTSTTTIEKNILHLSGLGFTQTPGGTGTGLAFSKWAVEQMDGRMRAWSTPSRSTCFEYDFPKVTPESRQEAERFRKKVQSQGTQALDEALKKQKAAQQARWAAR
ncbi:MAG: ATP-binding protein [Myxococcota bacterium]